MPNKNNLDYLSDRKFCQVMTTYQKWQMPRFGAVAGKTGLAFCENSTLLKTDGQLVHSSWATYANESGNSHQQVGQLASTRWATRIDKMGKQQKTGRLIEVSRPVHQR